MSMMHRRWGAIMLTRYLMSNEEMWAKLVGMTSSYDIAA